MGLENVCVVAMAATASLVCSIRVYPCLSVDIAFSFRQPRMPSLRNISFTPRMAWRERLSFSISAMRTWSSP